MCGVTLQQAACYIKPNALAGHPCTNGEKEIKTSLKGYQQSTPQVRGFLEASIKLYYKCLSRS